MSDPNTSQEAREGLIVSIKGKAKEVAGAMTGNDSLTAEGQLEQTAGRQRREAARTEAVAEAEDDQARAEAREARVAGAQERVAANTERGAAEQAVVAQHAAQKDAVEQTVRRAAEDDQARAELDAHHEMARARSQERDKINDALNDAALALAEHQSSVQVSRGH